MEPFISSTPVKTTPADTIVVCCSDGRLRRQTAEFIEHLGTEADLYVVPGGPLVFVRGVESFLDSSVALRRLQFLAQEHGTKRIILVTHGSEEESRQCGMSKLLFRAVSPAERVKKQKSAVLEAAKHLAAELSLPVECFYANVVGDTVQFEALNTA